MGAHLDAARCFAGPQDDGHRFAAIRVVDVDRQEAALVIMSVEQRELLVAMTEELAFELRKQGKLAGCLAVKIRYANFDTHTQQLTIPYTAADHLLIGKAKELFCKLYNRRLLIRLLGVRLSNLVQGFQQIDLFEDTTELTNLYQAMDRIRFRYGTKAVGRASGVK